MFDSLSSRMSAALHERTGAMGEFIGNKCYWQHLAELSGVLKCVCFLAAHNRFSFWISTPYCADIYLDSAMVPIEGLKVTKKGKRDTGYSKLKVKYKAKKPFACVQLLSDK